MTPRSRRGLAALMSDRPDGGDSLQGVARADLAAQRAVRFARVRDLAEIAPPAAAIVSSCTSRPTTVAVCPMVRPLVYGALLRAVRAIPGIKRRRRATPKLTLGPSTRLRCRQLRSCSRSLQARRRRRAQDRDVARRQVEAPPRPRFGKRRAPDGIRRNRREEPGDGGQRASPSGGRSTFLRGQSRGVPARRRRHHAGRPQGPSRNLRTATQ